MKFFAASLSLILLASTAFSLTYQKVAYEKHELPLYINLVRSFLGNFWYKS